MINLFDSNWARLLESLWIPICIQFAALLVGVFLNKLINKTLREKFSNNADNFQYIFIHALKGVPISWCSGVGLYWTITSVDIAPRIQLLLSNILLGVILYTITRVAARTCVGMIDMHTQKSDANLPKTSLLTNIVNIMIYALGALIILQSYGISVTPIITALGIGGMALAFGLQETLANIFAGLHLILSKQIRVADYIRLSTGEEGCVTDISWRFTTIQSGSNVIVIPNQKIASAILTNYNLPAQEIAIIVPVGVSYDSDLEHVERVTLEVANEVMRTIEADAELTPPNVRFHTFADSSINFNVTLRSAQYMNQFILKHEFIKALTKRYREERIDIPFPIRTLIQEERPARVPNAG